MVRRELSFSVEKFLGTRSVESAKGCKGDRKRVWMAKNFAALYNPVDHSGFLRHGGPRSGKAVGRQFRKTHLHEKHTEHLSTIAQVWDEAVRRKPKS
jgi:hypothetical protein